LAAFARFALLGVPFAGVAFFPALPLAGATCAPRGARAALLGVASPAGWAVALVVGSAIFFIVIVLLGGLYRVMTSITPVGNESKAIRAGPSALGREQPEIDERESTS